MLLKQEMVDMVLLVGLGTELYSSLDKSIE